MAAIITNVTDAISFINTLYEMDDTAPTSGDEDYTVWLALLNVAVNLWETEEGVLWNELFVELADAATGDKTTDGTNSYDYPTDLVFPASAWVWVGTNPSATAYKVMDIKQVQLLKNDSGNWCYFIDGKLEFNPNLTMNTGYTISYNYYKTATKLTTGADTFEMSDPLFAVYYALGELKKEEGDTSALQIASQKLEAMKTKNIMPTWLQSDNNIEVSTDEGLG